MATPPAPARLRAESVPGAVLLDFENLVHGLSRKQDSESLVEVACLPALGALVRELVHPGVRRAYGDWRVRDLNQFQVELYRSGFEIVQVLGRLTPGARKNSSDIRLAVDAVELALLEPRLTRFVIASGDRDMIEIVRCLQKHGREVIVIAPEGSASTDLSDICDRFIPYSEVQRRAGLVVRTMSVHALRSEPSGPARDPTDADRVEPWIDGAPRIVEAVNGSALVAPAAIVPGQSQLVARARLSNYRYEGDPVRRRRILDAIHTAARSAAGFSLGRLRTALADPASGLELRPGDVNKCWTVLYQGRAFTPVVVDEAVPLQFRTHVLAADALSPEGLTRIYERGIVYKLLENSRSEPTAGEVRVLLGLQEEDLGWCTRLLDEARRLLRGT